MINQNNKVTAVLFVLALALAPMVQAMPEPQGGPTTIRNTPKARARPAQVARPYRPANLVADEAAGDQRGGGFSSTLPVITVYATDNVERGKIGTFVLRMKPTLMLGGTYVNFSLSGTAVNGVDYKLLTSPAYISQSGYGTIQIETNADPRGSASKQAYSVIVT